MVFDTQNPDESIPDVEILSAPLRCIQVNELWCPWIAGFLQSYVNDNVWIDEIVQNRIFDFISQLYIGDCPNLATVYNNSPNSTGTVDITNTSFQSISSLNFELEITLERASLVHINASISYRAVTAGTNSYIGIAHTIQGFNNNAIEFGRDWNSTSALKSYECSKYLYMPAGTYTFNLQFLRSGGNVRVDLDTTRGVQIAIF